MYYNPYYPAPNPNQLPPSLTLPGVPSPLPPPPSPACGMDPFFWLAEQCFIAVNNGIQCATYALQELSRQPPPSDCSARVVIGPNCLDVIDERRHRYMLLGSVPVHTYVLKFHPLFNHEAIFSVEFHNHSRVLIPERLWTPKGICDALSRAGLKVGSSLPQSKIGQHLLCFLNDIRKDFLLPFFSGWDGIGTSAHYTPILRAREPGGLSGQMLAEWLTAQNTPVQSSPPSGLGNNMEALLAHCQKHVSDPAVRLFLFCYLHYGVAFTRFQQEELALNKIPVLCSKSAAGIRSLFDGFHSPGYNIPEISMPSKKFEEVVFCAKDDVMLVSDVTSELGDSNKNLKYLDQLVHGGTYSRPCREEYGAGQRQMALQAAPLICSERALHLAAPSLFFLLPAEDLQIPRLSAEVWLGYIHGFNRFLALHPELLSGTSPLPDWLFSVCDSMESEQFFRVLYAVWRMSAAYARLNDISIDDYFGGDAGVREAFLLLVEWFQQEEYSFGLADLFIDSLKQLLTEGQLIPVELHRRATPPDDYESLPYVFRRRANGTLRLNKVAVEMIVQDIAPDLLPHHVLSDLRREGLIGPTTNPETYYTKTPIYSVNKKKPSPLKVVPLALPEPLFGPGEPDPFKTKRS